MSQLPNLIGLSGYARSGKDSVAAVLVREYGYERIAFADPIKELLYKINPHVDGDLYLRYLVDKQGWEEAKLFPKTRMMLQELGVGARDLFGENFWIDQALAKAKNEHRVVITDVRFKNEAQMITINGGQLWRVERRFTGPVNDHISESELNGHPFDHVIRNDAGLNALQTEVANIMRHARITMV